MRDIDLLSLTILALLGSGLGSMPAASADARFMLTLATQSNTSATCTAGCGSKFYACEGPCLATPNGTTITPSLTTAGVTNNPNQCRENCSTQMQTCQRNCSLQ
jgi:hypothetical protein